VGDTTTLEGFSIATLGDTITPESRSIARVVPLHRTVSHRSQTFRDSIALVPLTTASRSLCAAIESDKARCHSLLATLGS